MSAKSVSHTLSADVSRRFWSKVNKRSGQRVRWARGRCWLWSAARDDDDYGIFQLAGVAQKAHRLAYQWRYGPIPHGFWVLHRCGQSACVRPSHLYLGTIRDNGRDMVQHGRSRCGERNRHARLTADVVRFIRRLYSDPRLKYRDHQALRAMFVKEWGITDSAVQAIVYGRSWRHLL